MKGIIRRLARIIINFIINWFKVQEEERPAERWGGLDRDKVIARMLKLSTKL